MTHVSRGYADQIAKDRGEAMDELERRNTTPPAASERMTAEWAVPFCLNCGHEIPQRPDLLAHVATLTARAEAAEADGMEKSSALVRLSALLAKDGEIIERLISTERELEAAEARANKQSEELVDLAGALELSERQLTAVRAATPHPDGGSDA